MLKCTWLLDIQITFPQVVNVEIDFERNDFVIFHENITF